MAFGTIYLTNQETCEIIVSPETPETIVAAREELEEAGIKPRTAEYIGNFAIDLTVATLPEVQKVILGAVVSD